MEETLRPDVQESEYKNPSEDSGGIRRRLRDRDLLKKRKAEAEEKETNQLESQRKRLRADQKSGAKRRGRPRKDESTAESAFIQGEVAQAQDAPAVELVPEPGEVIPLQPSGPLTSSLAMGSDTLELQPILADVTPLPVLPPVQSSSSLFEPVLTPPPPISSTPVLFSPSILSPPPSVVPDVAPVPAQAQDLPPVPGAAAVVSALPQEPIPAAPPIVPTQLETLTTESESKEALDQVLIEDLGPDEEEVPPNQETRVDDESCEVPSNNAQEQNKIFSFTSLSTLTPPQEYLPGN